MSDYSVHLNFQRFLTTARGFAGDTRGNFATMTAILLLPMFGFSALAIDHWSVASAKSEIENAADAAALGAISRAAAVLRATGDKALAIREGQAAGQDQFLGNVGKIPGAAVRTPKIVVMLKGLEVNSSIVWDGDVKTTLGSLFNWSKQDLTGSTASSLTMPGYVQIHIMVDNSGSMGIGATKDAQDKLFNLNGCAIACHLNNSAYRKAKDAGIRTRIDVVRDVLIDVGKSASATATIPNQIKIGVYTFSNDFVEMVRITDPEATRMDLFEKKMNDQFGLAAQGGGTDFRGAFKKLESLVREGGEGLTESKPLVFVFFITDGIENTSWNRSPGWYQVDTDAIGKNGDALALSPHPKIEKLNGVFHGTYTYKGENRRDAGWIQALDDKICNNVKQKGKLLSLEIEYIIPEPKYWGHHGSEDIRFGWVQENILKKENNYTLSHNRFRKCASTTDDAFRATTDKEIEASIKAMFDKVTPRPPRLLK